LVDRLSSRPPGTVILLDPSGRRIGGMLGSGSGVFLAESMRDAVHLARSRTPRGGVVLLSPAAPSYGSYRSFVERGEDFARCAGIRTDRPGTA
jgi:UDP-N-acetylmuramoyl-L-alanine---L-glutamate ligase